MKLHDWSIVRTADKKGLSIKNVKAGVDEYEVCVSFDNNRIEISLHLDGRYTPISEMSFPIKENEE
jgi:hypothetical protein